MSFLVGCAAPSDGSKLYSSPVIRGACVSACVFFSGLRVSFKVSACVFSSGLRGTFAWLEAVPHSGHLRCVHVSF